MSTPICDFVNKYIASSPVRMHMPGHKGKAMLGFEPYDLTEIDGADDLMAPDGIIAQSEAEASRLFGARTFYSCGGSHGCDAPVLPRKPFGYLLRGYVAGNVALLIVRIYPFYAYIK